MKKKSPVKKSTTKTIKKYSARKTEARNKKSTGKIKKQTSKKTSGKIEKNISSVTRIKKEKAKPAKVQKIVSKKEIKPAPKTKTTIKKVRKIAEKKPEKLKNKRHEKLKKEKKSLKKPTQIKKLVSVKKEAEKEPEVKITGKKALASTKTRKEKIPTKKQMPSVKIKKAKAAKILIPKKIEIKKEKTVREAKEKEAPKLKKTESIRIKKATIEVKRPLETVKEKKRVREEKKTREQKIEKTKKTEKISIPSIKELEQEALKERAIETERSALQIKKEIPERKEPGTKGEIIKYPVSPVETLPSEYGENGITLIVVDPYRLFSFWEVKEDTLKIFKGELTLKIYDITDNDPTCEELPLFLEKKVSQRIGDMYIDVLPGKKYIADIGIIFSEGIFISVARSNDVTTPEIIFPEKKIEIYIEHPSKPGY